MNESEIKILNEIIDNMDKILIEKQDKFQDTWKSCGLKYLKHSLYQRAIKLYFYPDLYTPETELRELIHIFNFAFFLYYRLKQESLSDYNYYDTCKFKT